MQCVSESCTSISPSTTQYFSPRCHVNSACTQHRSTVWGVAMTWSTLFWSEYVLNNFDVSRQLAERWEACLLRLLPRQCMRGGWQHEENLLLTSGGRAAVHLVSDCQKYYSSTIFIVRLLEEEKSQASVHLFRAWLINIGSSCSGTSFRASTISVSFLSFIGT